MHQAPAFLLAALATLGPSSLPAQTETMVHIHVSARDCLIGTLNVPCSDVGATLRELGTPLDAHIDLSGDAHATYGTISAAIWSLRSAGFRLKLGYINAQAQ
jgi:biopolymer transport protein ExbD